VVFNGGILNVSAGTLSISTTRGMQAHLDQYVIAPANGNAARFEIEKTESSLSIHALSGALTVSAPEKTFILAEGASATATPDSTDAKAKDTSPAPAIAASNASHNYKYWKWTLIVAGAAGAGVAIGAAALSNQGAPYCGTGACSTPPSVSPHSPCVCPK
jgi:F0F1-type ATP synthase epsilon subunit